ncbi:MAG: hypoxanthine phosphoribosyltransferase, partial [Clostridia bacterium]|nr:hypoxanthine phosphoribosyltransferase [Clostridia bacterium]
ILVTEEELTQIVDRMADQIDRFYERKEGKLLLLGILKGSVVFMGDLMKQLSLPVEIDFMKVSSYGRETVSNGKPTIVLDLHRRDLSDCNVLIVEDIVDSGRTLVYLKDYLRIKGARSIHTATLLDKPSRRVVDYVPDFVGREIPDAFVVGYGLDYAEKYRELPYIGVLKPEVYTHK